MNLEEKLLMTGDIKIIKLPAGICEGAIETYPEKYLNEWRLNPVGTGTTREGSPRKKNITRGVEKSEYLSKQRKSKNLE